MRLSIASLILMMMMAARVSCNDRYCQRKDMACQLLQPTTLTANASRCMALCDADPKCQSVRVHGELCNILNITCTNLQLEAKPGMSDYYKHNGTCDGGGGGTVKRFRQLVRDVWRFGAFIVGPVGIVSNLLIIYVMSRDRLHSSTILFQSIAVFDTILIIGSFDYFGDTKPSYVTSDFITLNRLAPLVSFCKKVSVYLLVLMTLERYMIVCYALHGSWFTVKRTKWTIVTLVLTMLSLVLVTDMPYVHTTGGPGTVVEYRLRQSYRFPDVVGNVNFSSFGSFDILTGTFYHSGILSFVVEFILPWPLLLVLNASIILTIRKAHVQRKKMSQVDTRDGAQNDVTKALVTVVLTFMVLELPRKIGFFFLPKTYVVQGQILNIFLGLEYVGRLLSILNASVNLYIYIMTGRKFRRILLGAFCPWCVEQVNEAKRGKLAASSSSDVTMMSMSTAG